MTAKSSGCESGSRKPIVLATASMASPTLNGMISSASDSGMVKPKKSIVPIAGISATCAWAGLKINMPANTQTRNVFRRFNVVRLLLFRV